MSNMTLQEIITAVRDGKAVESDDMAYAICAMGALMTFDHRALMNLVEAEEEGKKPFLVYSAKFQYSERFNRLKKAMAKPPKEWVGWNNDPKNPAFQERRKSSIGLMNKLMA